MTKKTATQKLIDYMEENYHLTDESRYQFKKALEEEIEQIKKAFTAGYEQGKKPNGKKVLQALKELRDSFTDEERKTMFGNDTNV